MLKKAPVIVLLLICGRVFGEDKPRLGILPFSGGPSGYAETITTLLTYRSDLKRSFSIVPVTNAVQAGLVERTLLSMDWIDADTAARLGRLINAEFVISGQIRRIGTQFLVIISLFRVGTFELLGGACREYRHLEEIPDLLPDLTAALTAMAQRNTSTLPTLAVAPPFIAEETAGRQAAESLLQILAIEIANTHRYAVLPRLNTGETAIHELSVMTPGYTQADAARVLGEIADTSHVLNIEVHPVETANVIAGFIVRGDNGSFVSGDSQNYNTMNDGYAMIADLARRIVGSPPLPLVPNTPDAPVMPPPSVVETPPPIQTEAPVPLPSPPDIETPLPR